mgnify:CR=1 FL=1
MWGELRIFPSPKAFIQGEKCKWRLASQFARCFALLDPRPSYFPHILTYFRNNTDGFFYSKMILVLHLSNLLFLKKVRASNPHAEAFVVWLLCHRHDLTKHSLQRLSASFRPLPAIRWPIQPKKDISNWKPPSTTATMSHAFTNIGWSKVTITVVFSQALEFLFWKCNYNWKMVNTRQTKQIMVSP